MDALKQGLDSIVHLVGGHHGPGYARGFAFLATGNGRKKNPGQCAGEDPGGLFRCPRSPFLVGYGVAYGTGFLVGADQPGGAQWLRPGQFFFPLTCGRHPAIISGGIAERAKFWPQLIATAVIVGTWASSSRASSGTSISACRLDQRACRAK